MWIVDRYSLSDKPIFLLPKNSEYIFSYRSSAYHYVDLAISVRNCRKGTTFYRGPGTAVLSMVTGLVVVILGKCNYDFYSNLKCKNSSFHLKSIMDFNQIISKTTTRPQTYYTPFDSAFNSIYYSLCGYFVHRQLWFLF